GASVPSNQGTVTVNPDGTLDFTPAANFNGPATISYTISDGHGGTSTATVTINVAPVNDPPVATNDGPLSTNEDTPLTGISVLPNDSDVDGDPLTVTGATVPATQGTVTVNPDGTLDFTPAANFNGPATISYTISDGHGGTSTATVTINVAPVNDPPVATNDGPLSTNEDTPLTGISVLPNDSDVDGDPLTVTGATVPATQGTVTVNPDGTLDFTPAANFNGPATISYTISDGHGGTSTATVTINVAPVNDPPVATNDGPLSTNEDTTLTGISVLPNDTDIDGDPLTVTGASVPSNQGTVTVNPDGTLDFTPAANFNGLATISYTISDGHGGTANATVTINVAPVNDPPVATGDQGGSPDGQPVTLTPLANDSDLEGDPLTITQIGGTAITPGGSVDLPSGVVTLNPDGTLTFAPKPGVQGDVAFDYQISDGHGGSATATVTLTIVPAGNVQPVPENMPSDPAVHLFGSQSGDPSVFREGDTFTAMPRLPIPFQPVIFVNQEVEASQAARQVTDQLGFSDPRVVRYGEIESTSMAAGLGFDPALFVQHAVRASQAESAFLDDVVFGRRSRINLSSDWRLQTPELMQADPLQPAPGDGQTGGRDDLAHAAPIAEPPQDAAIPRLASDEPGPDRPLQSAAPSFSEQLRRAASRAPTAAVKPTSLDRS
ncbi:MAG TPA: Ig-like domain-containing protein, partial [Accumulibacter sp.]|nr:Ig-like domain-containing protein [Accumulibacter sp.]